MEKFVFNLQVLKGYKTRYSIALVSDFFCPNTGGVETHIYHLGKYLLENGHKVIVLTHSYGSRSGIFYLSTGLKVYYLPFLTINNCYLPSLPGSLYWFRKIFLLERISIVHCHSSFSTMAHEALFHAWCLGLRTVFTDHSLFGFTDSYAILMNKLLLRYSLQNANRFICVSHICKDNTILRAGLQPEKVFVIPNAIDSSLFKPDPGQFHAPPTTVVVMSRLVYRKGADLLVEVLPVVCRHHSRVRFLIGGDGPKRIALEEMRERERLQSRVKLLGTLPHNKVREVLVQGQIFLNTSLTEAFCMGIVEAASCGLFVVSTRVGGIPEVLPPEFMSLADPIPGALSEALLAAIRRREAGHLMCPLEKHRAVKQMYNWADVATRTEVVYEAAMNDPDVPIKARLSNFLTIGFWFGLVWVFGTILNLAALWLIDRFWPREQYDASEHTHQPTAKGRRISASESRHSLKPELHLPESNGSTTSVSATGNSAGRRRTRNSKTRIK